MVSQATQLAGRIGKRSSSTGEIVWMPDNQFRVALKDAKDKKEAALMALLKSGKIDNKILVDKFEECESVHEELIFQAVQHEKEDVANAALTREESYKAEVHQLKRNLNEKDDDIAKLKLKIASLENMQIEDLC